MSVLLSLVRRAVVALSLLVVAGTAAAQTAPYTLSAWTGTSATVHEYEVFTPQVRVLDANGIPVANHTVNWSAPSGSTFTASTLTDGNGVAFTSFSHYQNGIYTVSAVTDDGFGIILVAPAAVGGGNAKPTWNTTPVDFTVTVENVGMAWDTPSDGNVSATTGVPSTLSVYWGGATRPKAGASISWSVTVPTGGGGAVMSAITNTDVNGISTADFTATTPGTYTVQAFNGCTWCGPSFVSFAVTVAAPPSADTSLTMSHSPDPVLPGDLLTLAINATNTGPDTATSLTLTAAVPADTTFESISAPAGWSCVTPAVGGTGTVTCTAASLLATNTDSFNLIVRVGASTPGGTIISANANLTAATGDPDPANQDTSTGATVATPSPALDVVKVLTNYNDNDSNSQITSGDDLLYEVTATNTGNVPLTNVVVTDDHFAATQTCTTLAVGAACVLTGSYTVLDSDAAAGHVDNIGTATSDETGPIDSAPVSTLVDFIPAPNMTLDKAYTSNDDNDLSGSVTENDVLHYTITATNTGNVTLTNLQIEDTQLTPGLEICSGISPGGTCLLSGTHTVTQAEAAILNVANTATATSTEFPGPISSATVNVPVEGPPTLAIVSGDGQAGYGGQSVTVVVVLRDGSGNPLPGRTISWTGANFGTTTTLADGTSSNTVSFSGVTGTLDVMAAYVPASLEVHFSLQSISASLGIVSGDGQAGAPNTVLPLPLTVLAADDGSPVATSLSWTVNSGDATVNPPSNTTDGSTGEAQATVTLGPTAGPVQVTVVRTDGSGESVVFNLVAGINRTLLIHDGNNQTGPAGSTLPLNLVVEAQDNGVNVDGIGITFSVISGDATVSPLTATTASGGYAVTSLTFGTTGGPVQVRAQRDDDPAAFVIFTATAQPVGVVVANGDNQTTPTGTTFTDLLVARTELDGLPQPGISLTWAVVSGDATIVPVTNPTDGSGNGYAQLTCGNTPGAVTVTATRDDFPAVATFSATCAFSRQLLAVAGDNQTAQAGTDFLQQLTVHALDNGAGAPGIQVDWVVVSGDATVSQATTLTDPIGLASVTLTAGATAGPVVVTATRADEPTAVVTFNETVTAPPVLTIVSGNAQTTTVDQEFALDLVVELTPTLVNRPIQWDITGGSGVFTGAVTTVTTFTDTNGQTRIRYTPTIDGSHQVRATSADCGCEVLFDLTANPVPPPTITIISGDGQAGLTSTVADAPLVVELRDGFGAPIAGQGIDFFVSGPGSVAPTSVFTDAAGRAQVTLTFGATAGPIIVDVQSAGVFDVVQFNATALAATLGIASGDGQSGPVNTMLPLPLEAVVVDPATPGPVGGRVGRQALDGVPVTFTVTSGGGSVTQTVVMTDATGHASTQFMLGPVPGLQTVTATVAGGSSVTFTATAILNRTLVLVSGNGQTAAPGSQLPNPLVVRAQDNGADAAGIGINWSVVTGSATVAPATASTDTAGLAQTIATLGATPGTVSIRAERADDPTVYVTFAATTAQLQLIPGLDDDQLEIAIVLDEACSTLAGMSSLTPPQQDLLARCQELIESSVLDPDATVDALDDLLPDVVYAMQESAFMASQAQFQNLKARIAALRSGTQGNGFNGLALSAPGGTVSLGGLVNSLTQDEEADKPTGEVGSDFSRWGFFASGTIGRGEAEEGSTRPAYDYDINGITVGIDYRKSDSLIFGAALGYTRQDTDLRGQDGQMEMSGWSVSGYGTWYRDNSWYSDAVITWGRNTFDLLRSITYTLPLPGGGTSVIDQTARSQSDGDMLEAAFTFGRDFQAGGWSIGPYGRLLYTKLTFDEIHDELEPGAGSGLGLEIDARTMTSVASEIGAKFTYAHSTDWGVVTPHFQLEWEHEFKDDPKAMTARFLADPNGTPFTLEGEELDADYLRLSLGLSVILSRGRSGFFLYERTLGRDDFDQQNFGFGLRIEF